MGIPDFSDTYPVRVYTRTVAIVLLRGLVFLTFLPDSGAALATDEPCAGFKWDVTRERDLFATAAESVMAGADAASAPLLMPERLYELSLVPQQQVTFQVVPGKTIVTDGAFGGLARLRLPMPGEFRISLDQSSWIDAVSDKHLVAARDFQGRRGCSTPHKIVLYSLPGGKDLLLQLSGAAGSRVRLTIVPVPAAAPR